MWSLRLTRKKISNFNAHTKQSCNKLEFNYARVVKSRRTKQLFEFNEGIAKFYGNCCERSLNPHGILSIYSKAPLVSSGVKNLRDALKTQAQSGFGLWIGEVMKWNWLCLWGEKVKAKGGKSHLAAKRKKINSSDVLWYRQRFILSINEFGFASRRHPRLPFKAQVKVNVISDA